MDFKLPERPEFSNKGTFGKVLNIAGSENYSGAAYLSSVSALKIGCGYVALSSSQKTMNTVITTSGVISQTTGLQLLAAVRGSM